jgi:hypothetical protein
MTTTAGGRLQRFSYYARLLGLAARVAWRAPRPQGRPVVFFNASTRLNGLSLNAAFALIAAWALRLGGTRVIHFVCNAGMARCVLGANPDDLNQAPPCARCVRQSRVNYAFAEARYFSFKADAALDKALENKSITDLMTFEFPLRSQNIPLGALVLPALRWRLRLHTLADDEATRRLFREYIRSAWQVAREFSALLDSSDPQAVVVFNGQFFPEATARWLARQRGIKTIAHEVGFQPMTAFFTTGEATAYPIDIPANFELDAAQNAKLDAYLEKRFQGKFSMAGIQFWPEMKGLDKDFLAKAASFKHIVPVFTNVIFDTSQPHSNVVFSDMFAWLDLVLETARRHRDTLFVVRAHPDESRPGKAARETVAGWVENRRAAEEPNIIFVPSDQFLSSYELIQRSKFVMIYNSTIGLEAAIMGAPVLCAGKARFTPYETVFFPQTQADYKRTLEDFLNIDKVAPNPRHVQQARRFLYYQLYRTSLPFEAYLESTDTKGYVRLKNFDLNALRPDISPALATIAEGVLGDGNLLLKEQ